MITQPDEYSNHLAYALASGLPDVLTRADDATNAANRAASCGKGRIKPADENGVLDECDEYPCASTNEGAAAQLPAGGSARTHEPCHITNLSTNASGPLGRSECLFHRTRTAPAVPT